MVARGHAGGWRWSQVVGWRDRILEGGNRFLPLKKVDLVQHPGVSFALRLHIVVRECWWTAFFGQKIDVLLRRNPKFWANRGDGIWVPEKHRIIC